MAADDDENERTCRDPAEDCRLKLKSLKKLKMDLSNSYETLDVVVEDEELDVVGEATSDGWVAFLR